MANLSNIRNRILKGRGLVHTRPSLKHNRKLTTEVSTPTIDNKTSLMRLVELRSGKTIEQIVLSGSLRYIEKEYGIDHSTASKWRRLLAVKSLEEIQKYLTPNIITGGNNGDTQLEGLPKLETSSSPGDNI